MKRTISVLDSVAPAAQILSEATRTKPREGAPESCWRPKTKVASATGPKRACDFQLGQVLLRRKELADKRNRRRVGHSQRRLTVRTDDVIDS
jgi:hypothetical protein